MIDERVMLFLFFCFIVYIKLKLLFLEKKQEYLLDEIEINMKKFLLLNFLSFFLQKPNCKAFYDIRSLYVAVFVISNT